MGTMGKRLGLSVGLLLAGLLVPAVVSAQTTLAGVVRDTSDAVLPGVTVETASPVLIEKVRVAITDGSGQYRITDLPPGTYAVTYSLTGFARVVRDEVVLAGSGVTTINIEMRVGALEETITVSGETPIVDVQSTRRESVLGTEAIRALPSTRSYGGLIANVPGLQVGGGGGGDGFGAQQTPFMTFFTAHGGRANEGRMTIDGLTVAASFNGGGVSTFTYDVANAEEMQVLVSGGLGEAEAGGPIINLVPRSGGNRFSGSAFYSAAGDWSRSDNIDDALRAVGITRPPALIKSWDVNGSLGGPILRDRLWFFTTGRTYGDARVVEGAFSNLNAGDATQWHYARDEGTETRSATAYKIFSVRLTSQLTPRNRVTFSQEQQYRCSGSALTQGADACRTPDTGWIAVGTATASPESWPGYHNAPYYVTQATWSSPVSNRLLFEAGYSRFHYIWYGFGQAPPDAVHEIPVTEQSAAMYGRANYTYRGIFDPFAFAYADHDANPNNWRGSASYVTGAHNIKFGYQGSYQKSNQGRIANRNLMRYRFNNGVPNGLSYYIAPEWYQADRTLSTSFYAQDQWTLGRLTLQGALRYDRASSWSPTDGNGTTTTSQFLPEPIGFPRTVSVKGYNDLTPRMGAAWDMFGDGRTSLKANVGRYLQNATNDQTYTANNPAARIVTAAGMFPFLGSGFARGWTDGNGNYVVDCDLTSPAAQNNLAAGGDNCGALTGNNLNFGNVNPNLTVINPAILEGWGVRPSDWQLGVSVQHEVLPRVSVELGYNRRWFQNFFVVDNTLVGPQDYEPWTLTAPQHPDLPGGGGYPVTVHTITQAAALRGAQNYQTFETDFGSARTWYWHGVDLTANARLANGIAFQGGTTTGRGVQDTCDTVVNIDNPDPRNCRVVEEFLTSFRGLAMYTVPKVEVLVSMTVRSLPGTTLGAGAASATNGNSLDANYNVPNTVVQQLLGRLPPGGFANGNTTVNLLIPGELYGDRVNQVDMRFAKILRFGGTRLDVGLDLYNLFNSNHTTGYEEVFDFATNGASWLQTTNIVSPRFVRVNMTVSY